MHVKVKFKSLYKSLFHLTKWFYFFLQAIKTTFRGEINLCLKDKKLSFVYKNFSSHQIHVSESNELYVFSFYMHILIQI